MGERQSHGSDDRWRRAESLLWAWAEAGPVAGGHEHGHPSTSPMYQAMRSGAGGAGRQASTGRWRQRVRRRGDHAVELTPAATCYGTETRSMRMPERTGPEADADKMGWSYTIGRIVREDMTPDMQALVYARFVERVPKREIPDRVEIRGLDKNTLPLLYRQVIETVARQVFDTQAGTPSMRIETPLPIA